MKCAASFLFKVIPASICMFQCFRQEVHTNYYMSLRNANFEEIGHNKINPHQRTRYQHDFVVRVL